MRGFSFSLTGLKNAITEIGIGNKKITEWSKTGVTMAMTNESSVVTNPATRRLTRNIRRVLTTE